MSSEGQPSEGQIASQGQESTAGVEPPLAFVFNGGGVKGYAFVGALEELADRLDPNHWPSTFGGTSAGAITAAILAMGYDAKTARQIMDGLAFTSFLDRSWEPKWDSAPWSQKAPDSPEVASSVSALRRWARGVAKSAHAFLKAVLAPVRVLVPALAGAAYSSAPVGRFIQHLMAWKPDGRAAEKRVEAHHSPGKTFGDLAPRELLIVAASSGKRTCHVFQAPDTTMDMAVRSSMAIPGVFERQTLGSDVLYDGGLVANFAYKEFCKTLPGRRWLGLYLYDGSAPARPADATSSLLATIKHAFLIYHGQGEGAVLDEHRGSILVIDTAPIETLDFDIDEKDKELLRESGRLGVIRFLQEHKGANLPLRSDAVPSRYDYEAHVARVKGLREEAKKRWLWPHRIRRIKFWLAFLLLFVGSPSSLVFAVVALAVPPATVEQGRLASSFEMLANEKWLQDTSRIGNVALDVLLMNGTPRVACFATRTVEREEFFCSSGQQSLLRCEEARQQVVSSEAYPVVDATCMTLELRCGNAGRVGVRSSRGGTSGWTCIDRTLQPLTEGLPAPGSCVRGSYATCVAQYDACDHCRHVGGRLPLRDELVGPSVEPVPGLREFIGTAIEGERAGCGRAPHPPLAGVSDGTLVANEAHSDVGFRCVYPQEEPRWTVVDDTRNYSGPWPRTSSLQPSLRRAGCSRRRAPRS